MAGKPRRSSVRNLKKTRNKFDRIQTKRRYEEKSFQQEERLQNIEKEVKKETYEDKSKGVFDMKKFNTKFTCRMCEKTFEKCLDRKCIS